VGTLNQTLTEPKTIHPDKQFDTIEVRRRGSSLQFYRLDPLQRIEDGGLFNASIEVIQSQRGDNTQFLVAYTTPGHEKIHHNFFLFIGPEGRGSLELRSLGGGGGASFLDLKCEL
jgi:hypothetical protein